MSLAIDDLRKVSSVRAAAAKLEILRSTLSDRLNGKVDTGSSWGETS